MIEEIIKRNIAFEYVVVFFILDITLCIKIDLRFKKIQIHSASNWLLNFKGAIIREKKNINGEVIKKSFHTTDLLV